MFGTQTYRSPGEHRDEIVLQDHERIAYVFGVVGVIAPALTDSSVVRGSVQSVWV
jgi:hypothetical protein